MHHTDHRQPTFVRFAHSKPVRSKPWDRQALIAGIRGLSVLRLTPAGHPSRIDYGGHQIRSDKRGAIGRMERHRQSFAVSERVRSSVRLN